VADDRIAELERVLRADPGGRILAALLLRALAGEGRGGELHRRLEAWLGEEPVEVVSEMEFDRAFEAAEPDVAEMITPHSVAEEAALAVDATPEERGPLASSGAFATRTMAELLEQQGDRRGAARIRAALGEVAASFAQRAQVSRSEPEASEDHPMGERRPSGGEAARGDAAVIAVLERWLGNARRLQP
jgi:hypothetical protein